MPGAAFIRRNSWATFLTPPGPLVEKETREDGLGGLGLHNSPAKIFIHL